MNNRSSNQLDIERRLRNKARDIEKRFSLAPEQKAINYLIQYGYHALKMIEKGDFSLLSSTRGSSQTFMGVRQGLREIGFFDEQEIKSRLESLGLDLDPSTSEGVRQAWLGSLDKLSILTEKERGKLKEEQIQNKVSGLVFVSKYYQQIRLDLWKPDIVLEVTPDDELVLRGQKNKIKSYLLYLVKHFNLEIYELGENLTLRGDFWQRITVNEWESKIEEFPILDPFFESCGWEMLSCSAGHSGQREHDINSRLFCFAKQGEPPLDR